MRAVTALEHLSKNIQDLNVNCERLCTPPPKLRYITVMILKLDHLTDPCIRLVAIYQCSCFFQLVSNVIKRRSIEWGRTPTAEHQQKTE